MFVRTITILLFLANIAMANNFSMGVASKGGAFYIVGQGMCNLATNILKEKNYIFNLKNSSGAVENIELMDKGEMQFAIVHSLLVNMAWNGNGIYNKPYKKLRAIAMLWPNVEQFMIKKQYVKTGNINDIKSLYNKPFSVTGKKSGSRESTEAIMAELGIDYNSMKLKYFGYLPSSKAMINGEIDGMNTPSGPPTPIVTNVFQELGNDVKILNITPQQLKKINQKYPIWEPLTIKKGTYPTQEYDIKTIAQPTMLVTTTDVSSEVVYEFVKALYDNISQLYKIHEAAKYMSIEKGAAGSPIPLHKGVRKYYKEQGININISKGLMYKIF